MPKERSGTSKPAPVAGQHVPPENIVMHNTLNATYKSKYPLVTTSRVWRSIPSHACVELRFVETVDTFAILADNKERNASKNYVVHTTTQMLYAMHKDSEMDYWQKRNVNPQHVAKMTDPPVVALAIQDSKYSMANADNSAFTPSTDNRCATYKMEQSHRPHRSLWE